eukprot:TRINITY_DN4307_c0_g1_i2.p2 TRINITY_DN4307_c0_g1~~TRINITY_DN4307_c0_g1_i2.p2  ORF type:complete len:153 (-),score=60.88 TRINITY_DN4307_c0_g1_i2:34-492(-)
MEKPKKKEEGKEKGAKENMYDDIEELPTQPLNVETDLLLQEIKVDEILDDMQRASSIEDVISESKGFDLETLSDMKFEEDDPMAKGSVTLQKLKETLSKIDDKKLSLVGIERKKQIIRDIDIIEKIKIVDPRVLLKIFETYKYKQPVLNDFI